VAVVEPVVTITRFLLGESGFRCCWPWQSVRQQTDRQTQVGNPGDQPRIRWFGKRPPEGVAQGHWARSSAAAGHKARRPLDRWKSAAERAQIEQSRVHRGGRAASQQQGPPGQSSEARLARSFQSRDAPLLGCPANSTAAPGWCRGWLPIRSSTGGQGARAAGNESTPTLPEFRAAVLAGKA